APPARLQRRGGPPRAPSAPAEPEGGGGGGEKEGGGAAQRRLQRGVELLGRAREPAVDARHRAAEEALLAGWPRDRGEPRGARGAAGRAPRGQEGWQEQEHPSVLARELPVTQRLPVGRRLRSAPVAR
ncbi:unnamed protein product, partial [Prorocentrum cordatum]